MVNTISVDSYKYIVEFTLQSYGDVWNAGPYLRSEIMGEFGQGAELSAALLAHNYCGREATPTMVAQKAADLLTASIADDSEHGGAVILHDAVYLHCEKSKQIIENTWGVKLR